MTKWLLVIRRAAGAAFDREAKRPSDYWTAKGLTLRVSVPTNRVATVPIVQRQLGASVEQRLAAARHEITTLRSSLTVSSGR